MEENYGDPRFSTKRNHAYREIFGRPQAPSPGPNTTIGHAGPPPPPPPPPHPHHVPPPHPGMHRPRSFQPQPPPSQPPPMQNMNQFAQFAPPLPPPPPPSAPTPGPHPHHHNPSLMLPSGTPGPGPSPGTISHSPSLRAPNSMPMNMNMMHHQFPPNQQQQQQQQQQHQQQHHHHFPPPPPQHHGPHGPPHHQQQQQQHPHQQMFPPPTPPPIALPYNPPKPPSLHLEHDSSEPLSPADSASVVDRQSSPHSDPHAPLDDAGSPTLTRKSSESDRASYYGRYSSSSYKRPSFTDSGQFSTVSTPNLSAKLSISTTSSASTTLAPSRSFRSHRSNPSTDSRMSTSSTTNNSNNHNHNQNQQNGTSGNPQKLQIDTSWSMMQPVYYPPPTSPLAYDSLQQQQQLLQMQQSSQQQHNLSSPVSPRSYSGTFTAIQSRKPLRKTEIYPALLSRVAEVFRSQIVLSDRIKDGLAYAQSFDGYEAVSLIADIVGTDDRNLALLLGRALDAQKFFHDVAYEHRLRDSHNEVYRLRDRLASGFVSSRENDVADHHHDHRLLSADHEHDHEFDHDNDSPVHQQAPISSSASTISPKAPLPHHSNSIDQESISPADDDENNNINDINDSTTSLSLSEINDIQKPPSSAVSTATAATQRQQNQQYQSSSFDNNKATRTDSESDSEDEFTPNGVFTLLTDCYSPTCSKRDLCYSCACPRRLEQLKYLGETDPEKGKTKGLQRQESSESLDQQPEPGTLWVHSVPQEVFDSVSDQEKKRQEAINEVIYTERDFVRDLEYIRDRWMKPLRTGNIIDADRREDFVTQVFWNILDILNVNAKLCEALNKRQKQHYVVEKISDVLMDHVVNFAPFVAYGSHQLYGKYEFEKEKSSNTEFSKFVDEIERLPESRKLELNGYLTKPTTRLARYPLLLGVVLKNTPDDHPDKTGIPQVIDTVKKFLAEVNSETGKSENRFELALLDQQLVFRPGEQVDLKLRDDGRELLHKGPLKKRGGGSQGDSAELMAILFDHALLLTKPKNSGQKSTLKVYRKPIPLQLLVVTSPEDGRGTARQKALMSRASSSKSNLPSGKESSKNVPPLIVQHLGKRGYTLYLHAPTTASRNKWLEKIEERQNALKNDCTVVEATPVCEGFFSSVNRVICAAPFDQGNKLVYGTDNGVYLHDIRSDRPPVRVIAVQNVTQVDVLEEYNLLIVLADRATQTFNINALDPADAVGVAKRTRKHTVATTFFKTGTCQNRTIICMAKTSAQSTTIKIFEPIDHSARNKKQPGLRKLLTNAAHQEHLKSYKELYLNKPYCTSLSFLKSKICISHQEGFEVVNFETLDTQGLLDPEDSSLDFIKRRETCRPIAIFRVDNDYLLCYNEFAFYINRNGWRTRADFFVTWEGNPHNFALLYPYLLAFDPTFVEVRNCLTGELLHAIVGGQSKIGQGMISSLRYLFADCPPATSAAAYAFPQQQQMYSNFHPPMQYGRHSMYGMQPSGPHMGPPRPTPSPYRRTNLVYFSNGEKVYRIKIIPSKVPHPTEPQQPPSSLPVHQHHQHQHHPPPPLPPPHHHQIRYPVPPPPSSLPPQYLAPRAMPPPHT